LAVANSAQLWLQPHAWPIQEFALDDGGNTAVAQAIALLDPTSQPRNNSNSCILLSRTPTASQSSATRISPGSLAQQQRVLFVAVQQASMAAAAAPSGKRAMYWRGNKDNTNRPGPVCPGAPRKPLPAVVLIPVTELGSACHHLRA
jgi:hypothetical protein